MKNLGLFLIPIKVNSSISTYNDYIDFLITAEKHGYTHAYIGEHLTDEKEDIQSSIVFAAALLARTKKLKVCLCVLPLPHYEIKLLIKQLEDLYLLSKGRLEIGFSQGALKSDAEYLNFRHDMRGEIFIEKLDFFMGEIKNSKVLKEMPMNNFFSTLLSPIPTKSSSLFDNGFSAITSNFVNEKFWENHIGCFTKNKAKVNSSSKWHLTLNLRPDKLNSLNSEKHIKLSLYYIFEKLKSCKLNVMIPNESDLDKYSYDILLENLNLNMTYNKIPDKFFYLKQKYKKWVSHPIINLFDCIDDLEYTSFILNFPKNGKF